MCILRRCATPLLFRRHHHQTRATTLSASIHLSVLPGLPPALPCRQYRSFHLKPTRSSSIAVLKKVRAFTTAAEVLVQEGGANSGDGFFAEEGVSWKSLGISEALCRALSGISLRQPSQIQAAAIPHVLTGNDVVIAAETGSGKTYGYLVPLIDNLCASSDNSSENASAEERPAAHKMSLVLCPNVMLCEQVVQMANCLVDESGGQLIRVAAVCGRQGWPLSRPHILVSTPVALLNCLFAFDAEKRRRAEFLRNVKFIVFDEADLLLCGSFQNQIIRLINMFRFDEKQLSSSVSSGDSLIDVHDKAQDSGLEDSNMLEDDVDYEEESDNGDGVDEFGSEENKLEASSVKDWRRVRKVYKRSKQYIFVAATLPVNGKKTAGGALKRMFPDAIWVSGNYLHRQNPRLEQRWVEVTRDTQVDSLLDAVKCLPERNFGNSPMQACRIMVFANTVDAVESVANILRRVGYECIPYHSESSLEERTKNLTDFRENSGILVCTDAAARGIDIPNVMHVIQAEFASSAVDFLHRIGRTARAGQPGLVTSLYTDTNRDLVAAVREAVRIGQPVEKAFSRKRSFRNKLKKQVREAAESKPRILA